MEYIVLVSFNSGNVNTKIYIYFLVLVNQNNIVIYFVIELWCDEGCT